MKQSHIQDSIWGRRAPQLSAGARRRAAIGHPNLLILYHYFLNTKDKECSPVQTQNVYTLELGLIEGDFLADITIIHQNSISN